MLRIVHTYLHDHFNLFFWHHLAIFLKKLMEMFFLEDMRPFSDILIERERREERMGSENLSNALLNLLSFWKSEEKYW